MRWLITLVCGFLLIGCTGAAVVPANNAPAPSPSHAAATDVEPQLLNHRAIMSRSLEPSSRKFVNGDVLVQFRLDEKGRARDARVVLAEPKGAFEKHALYLVSMMRFSLPPEWVAGNQSRIFEFAFLYLMDQCQMRDPFPGVTTMTITGWSKINSTRNAYKMMDLCDEKRESSSPAIQPAQ